MEWISIRAGTVDLPGVLELPPEPIGLVVFAHGSGSSRLSPRNAMVAGELNRRGFGTLLFDLLSSDEEADMTNVFDIELLAGRLAAAGRWSASRAALLPLGYFGASTGAAAALWAASADPGGVRAVVSRGGRPDLAGARLGAVEAPTLLIVGGKDPQVLELNRQALARMTCECRLEVVPGATHLFEEPGALESVAVLAGDWFGTCFGRAPGTPVDS